MTRAEKIALLTAALQGQTDGLRALKRQRETVTGVAIFEDPNRAPESRVCWWREDGSRVIETEAEFSQREVSSGILMPHNSRDAYFEADH